MDELSLNGAGIPSDLALDASLRMTLDGIERDLVRSLPEDQLGAADALGLQMSKCHCGGNCRGTCKGRCTHLLGG